MSCSRRLSRSDMMLCASLRHVSRSRLPPWHQKTKRTNLRLNVDATRGAGQPATEQGFERRPREGSGL
eukprot:8807265-Pyramimonas_sp.AAC.1